MIKGHLLWRGGAVLGLLAVPAAMAASPASAIAESSANLRLTKSCSPANASLVPGDTITCTISVTNLGPNTSFDVEVTDDVSAGQTVVSATGPAGTSCTTTNVTDPEVTCFITSIPNGGTVVITVVSTVNNNVGPNRTLTDTAKANGRQTFDPDTTNNVATANVNTVACTIDFRNATQGQTITGTSGDDVICGSDFADVIDGLGGNDIIFGFGGADIISGGAGNDRIFGGDGDDILNGNAGDDSLFGGAGNDVLDGGAGFDRLTGDSGVDACTGEVKTTCED